MEEFLAVLLGLFGLTIIYFLFKALLSNKNQEYEDLKTQIRMQQTLDEMNKLKSGSYQDETTKVIFDRIKSSKVYQDLLKDRNAMDTLFYQFCFHPNVYSSIMDRSDEKISEIALSLLRSRLGEFPFSKSLFTSFLNKELKLRFTLENGIIIESITKERYKFLEYQIPYGEVDNNYLNILEFDKDKLGLIKQKDFLSLARAFIINVENGLPSNIFVLVQSLLGFSVREVYPDSISSRILDLSQDPEEESINYYELIQYLQSK